MEGCRYVKRYSGTRTLSNSRAPAPLRLPRATPGRLHAPRGAVGAAPPPSPSRGAHTRAGARPRHTGTAALRALRPRPALAEETNSRAPAGMRLG